jgi:hypothetical protein
VVIGVDRLAKHKGAGSTPVTRSRKVRDIDTLTGDTVNMRACTVTAQWWLDMDDPANAALLKVPLVGRLPKPAPAGILHGVGHHGSMVPPRRAG